MTRDELDEIESLATQAVLAADNAVAQSVRIRDAIAARQAVIVAVCSALRRAANGARTVPLPETEDAILRAQMASLRQTLAELNARTAPEAVA